MKLSIIVPVYNMASDERLAWCLNSLVNQRTMEGRPLADYEIIAVDDCSTDDSAQLLREYAARYPGKVTALFGDRNRHQGGAKNQGLARARGEWIAFIDADDWVVETYFAQLLSKAGETGADCVGTDYCIVHAHTMEPGPVVANSRAEQAGIVDEARRRSLLVDFGSLCVKIYRREIVYGELDPLCGAGQSHLKPAGVSAWTAPPDVRAQEPEPAAAQPKAGPGEVRERPPERAEGGEARWLSIFPEDIFYEDNAVVKTWVMRIGHFEYVPGPLYYYYQHEDSTVHTVSLRRLEDRLTSGRIMVREARQRGYLAPYHDEIEYSFTVLFYKNTLFGALQSLKGSSVYAFVTAIGREMKETFPDFQDNPYYQERTNAEEKKLIAMQMASPRRFYIYYRLLWLYRRLRYGKKNG